jgi:hypothetical protein
MHPATTEEALNIDAPKPPQAPTASQTSYIRLPTSDSIEEPAPPRVQRQHYVGFNNGLSAAQPNLVEGLDLRQFGPFPSP